MIKQSEGSEHDKEEAAGLKAAQLIAHEFPPKKPQNLNKRWKKKLQIRETAAQRKILVHKLEMKCRLFLMPAQIFR